MKKRVLRALVELVFLVIFNLFFFVLGGTNHPASVWISYGFIHFAYIMTLLTPVLSGSGTHDAAFGLSIYAVSTVYFAVEFVVGLIFVFVGAETFVAALLVQVAIAGLYLIALFTFLLANEHTAGTISRRDSDAAFIKSECARLKILAERMHNPEANKSIGRVYDLLHASPIASNDAAYPAECEISNKITELEKAVKADDAGAVVALCKEITLIIGERNAVL